MVYKSYPRCLLVAGCMCLTSLLYAQDPGRQDCLAKLRTYDLGKLWHADSIQTEGNYEKAPFPEPLGYIGINYQRFYIHYIPYKRTGPIRCYFTSQARQE